MYCHWNSNCMYPRICYYLYYLKIYSRHATKQDKIVKYYTKQKAFCPWLDQQVFSINICLKEVWICPVVRISLQKKQQQQQQKKQLLTSSNKCTHRKESGYNILSPPKKCYGFCHCFNFNIKVLSQELVWMVWAHFIIMCHFRSCLRNVQCQHEHRLCTKTNKQTMLQCPLQIKLARLVNCTTQYYSQLHIYIYSNNKKQSIYRTLWSGTGRHTRISYQ